MTEKGQSRKTFEVPDGDLQKYTEVKIEESKLAQQGETVPGAENATAPFATELLASAVAGRDKFAKTA